MKMEGYEKWRLRSSEQRTRQREMNERTADAKCEIEENYNSIRCPSIRFLPFTINIKTIKCNSYLIVI